jgi:hypothetical protein
MYLYGWNGLLDWAGVGRDTIVFLNHIHELMHILHESPLNCKVSPFSSLYASAPDSLTIPRQSRK